jgi:hypothetical protein
MKLVKSLLLGSAAGLMAVAGAQAADLPSRKAAPAEFVRVCSAYGAGFFFIPGTETCLRIGGRVRAEYLVGERQFRDEDTFGFRARARLNVDARTATSFGTLRTFMRFEYTANSGQYRSYLRRDRIDTLDNGGTGIEYAFIQFAGITAGRAASFFGTAYDESMGGIKGLSDLTVNLLAYTASFGGGFSATLALEDGASRRSEVPVVGTAFGREYPDVVANLNVEQSWGAFRLSGALHQVRGDDTLSLINRPYNQTGYAIGAALKINLPMIAAGDWFAIEAGYAAGALSYLKVGDNVRATSRGLGDFGIADNFYALGGGSKLTTGFVVNANFVHYWTPQVRQNLFGSYLAVDQGSLANPGFRGDLVEWRAGTNIYWSPVSGLDLGVEILYVNSERSRRGPAFADRRISDDSWQARLRIQRDF